MDHTAEQPADDLWNAITGRLRDILTGSAYETGFGQARPRSLQGEKLVVEVPNDFTRDWIQGHLLEAVRRATIESNPDVAVSFAVVERPPAEPAEQVAPVPEPPASGSRNCPRRARRSRSR